MIRINEIRVELTENEDSLLKKAAKILRINESQIKELKIFKKSVDARKKDDVHFKYSVNIAADNESSIVEKCKSKKALIFEPKPFVMPENMRRSEFRPIIAGFGPAGMFAGLLLAKSGLRPIILERGKKIEDRQRDVNKFWKERKLDENSNVQFGEGGAGTFSDGKLTTGIKSPYISTVLEELYEAGAPEEILYSSKPHIGTDRLAVVVKNIRRKITKLGGEVLLQSKLEKIISANGFVHGITYRNSAGELCDVETDTLILAIGHSARDTVEMLFILVIKIFV